MDSLFREIKRQERLSDRVQAQVQDLILGQKLQAGDKLPPERELAELLGVSRTVVREAIRSLAAKGLLEVRTGSGMYVRNLPREIVSESMGLFVRTRVKDKQHIYEVRRVLEVEIAGLAAERATPDDVSALEESVKRISQPHRKAETLAREDVDFHARLAEATHNELYCILLDSIADIMLEVRLLGFSLPETRDMAVHLHGKISERVKAQDVEGARKAMEEHVNESVVTMTKAVKAQQQREAK